jgi:hypothetical protein
MDSNSIDILFTGDKMKDRPENGCHREAIFNLTIVTGFSAYCIIKKEAVKKQMKAGMFAERIASRVLARRNLAWPVRFINFRRPVLLTIFSCFFLTSPLSSWCYRFGP